jgi:hypothetical protein
MAGVNCVRAKIYSGVSQCVMRTQPTKVPTPLFNITMC